MKPSAAAALEGALDQVVPEHLRRLRQHQLLARDRAADAHVLGVRLVACFTVSTGTIPTMAAPASAASSDDLFDGLQIDERPHRIVHRHQVGIGGERRQSVRHRFLPAVAALHHPHGLVADLAAQQLADPLQIFAAQGHHDLA